MELNFSCINGEISRIINNRNKYDYDVVLLCLVVKEYLMQIKINKIIPKEFIEYLSCIKNYLNCDIDFRLLIILSENDNKVNIIDNSELFCTSLSSSLSSSSGDFDFKITKLLEEDTKNMNKIYEFYNIHHDKHKLAQCIFELIDSDNDGFISALDILIMLHENMNEPFVDDDFKYSIINLIAVNQCNTINFNMFMNIFF